MTKKSGANVTQRDSRSTLGNRSAPERRVGRGNLRAPPACWRRSRCAHHPGGGGWSPYRVGASQVTGPPLHPQGHPKILSRRSAESILRPHPCARSLCDPWARLGGAGVALCPESTREEQSSATLSCVDLARCHSLHGFWPLAGQRRHQRPPDEPGAPGTVAREQDGPSSPVASHSPLVLLQ